MSDHTFSQPFYGTLIGEYGIMNELGIFCKENWWHVYDENLTLQILGCLLLFMLEYYKISFIISMNYIILEYLE